MPEMPVPQRNEQNNWSRRTFLTASALCAASTAGSLASPDPEPSTAAWDLLRPPDSLSIYLDNAPTTLQRTGPAWQASGIEIVTEAAPQHLSITVQAPTFPLTRVHLRWKLPVAPHLLFLGDAWERSYGELCWRSMVPERVLPWYFATHDGQAGQTTHAYGVQTGAGALCFWQVDPQGVSLWLDLSNGGSGVLLGQRVLPAATLVSHAGTPGQHPQEAISALCRKMCPHPRLPAGPIYGTNDWYYAYGRNTAANILRDTDLVVELAPTSGARPFSVIDGGWEGDGTTARGQQPNPNFPDMAGLAEEIRKRDARPGIWIRPLEAAPGADPALLLPTSRFASAADNDATYDPTIPEALHAALTRVQRLVDWKYDLIKHDFSTYDLLGQWGFSMGAQPARPGWNFHDRTRTTAEIIRHFYQAIRDTAGDQTLVEGCNTIGHLGAGLFEMQRIGDDTSGRQWERTRRMGINTLAYRLPQHQTFFAIDADCVGITRSIPWELNRQWLDLLARSGTSLFISPAPDAVGPEQKAALAAAFTLACGFSEGRPQDWLTSISPAAWEFRRPGQPGQSAVYDWCDPSGADPYPI
jgi:alpha-galactosidase